MNTKVSEGLWQKITSRRLALWLIFIMSILAVLSMLIPQISYNAQTYSEWSKSHSNLSNFIEVFQLQKIYHSYVFLTVTIFFSINLLCCTVQQVYRIRKKLSLEQLDPKPKKYPLEAEITINTKESILKEEIVAFLKQFKFKITCKDKLIIAEKGKLGIWGAPIFHLGLIIIIVGGLITNYFSMEGYFRVSEGEVFQESHASYVPESLDEAPLFREQSHPGYQLKLEKQERYFKGKLLDYTRSYLVLGQKDQELNTRGEVERGKPFKYKGIIFYHKDSGFSPELIFKKNGEDIGSTFFSLNTSPINTKGKFTYSGEFKNLESEGYKLKISFFPDLIQRGIDQYDYDSMDIKNPAFFVEIFKHNQLIYKGLLKSGQWAKFDDFELSFGKTILWVGLDTVKDPGAQVLFIGFFISMLGLIILYGIVPKKLYFQLKQDNGKESYKVSGYSRKYQLFFQDEFRELVDKLGKQNLTR